MSIIRDRIEKLMCPQASNFPIAEAHMLRNRMLDAFSEGGKPYENADGDMPEPLDRAYANAAGGPVSTSMDLFVHEVGVRRGAAYVMVVEVPHVRLHPAGPAAQQEQPVTDAPESRSR